MLSKTFQNLPAQRQETILVACLEEFASKGYDAASTNHIVTRLGIAKGTLFKYAKSKETLYLHLFEDVLEELAAIQDARSTYHSPDLFVRLEELFEALLNYAQRHPTRYFFSLRATTDTSASVYPKTEEIRRRISGQHMTALFEGVDWSLYCHPRDELLEIFKWLVGGTRLTAIEALNRGFNMDIYVNQVHVQMELLRKLLRNGVYARKEYQP